MPNAQQSNVCSSFEMMANKSFNEALNKVIFCLSPVYFRMTPLLCPVSVDILRVHLIVVFFYHYNSKSTIKKETKLNYSLFYY